MILEVCAGSLKDCLLAQECDADRIELNSSLHLGGITPSLGLLMEVKKSVTIPIICMIRPRGAGFIYNKEDQKVMFSDAQLLLENGADGLAFGFLTEDKQIDFKLSEEMIKLCHRYGKEAVFHRAIDCLEDMETGIEGLIRLGCNRILTSGGRNTAEEGMGTLYHLHQKYGESISFCMAAGISPENIEGLMNQTGIKECHGTFKGWYPDSSTSGPFVSYRYNNRDAYEGVDRHKLIKTIEKIRKR